MNNKHYSSSQEQIIAIRIIWFIISLTTTSILLFVFFVKKQTILANTPLCISMSKYHIECSLCGMTRAFIEISHGKFHNAYLLNKGSILLFLSFLLNSLFFFIYAFNLIFFQKQKVTVFINDS